MERSVLRAAALALGCLALAACDRSGAATTGAEGEVLARIDGQVITAAELQRRLDSLDAYGKARFSTPEQKRKFLENLVRFEELAHEAQSRGYERDPEVQRALKQQMVSSLLDRELDSKLRPEDVSDAEVERYYREHLGEFRRPEEVRVSQIFTVDQAKADKAAAATRALAGETDKGFRKLVDELSEDDDSKGRGGDLTFFDRNTTLYPRPLVEAAFALKETGEVSPPVHTERGYHVLVLTQRRPSFTRALPEAAREIRKQLLAERRAKKVEEMVAETRKHVKVEIYEDKLAKVAVTGGRP